MSYILDALRRAQAERERGQVPGLHAQPALGGLPRLAPADKRPRWQGPLLGAAAVLVLLLPLMWWLSRSGPAPASAPATLATPASSRAADAGLAATTGATPQAAQPAGLAVEPAAPLVVVTAPPPPPRPSPRPAPGPVAETAPPGVAAAAARPPAAALGAASAATPLAPARSTATATGTAPATALPPPLSAEQRRSWPPFSLGGSVWSETASARFVILGGQVIHEGGSTPDGVFVERITPKAAVLRWRDQRASLPF